MFTIPKWVVYDIVFPTLLVNDLGKFHHELTVLPHEKKMQPTNPNAHTYVNGTDVKTHGYAVTHNTFLQ